MINKLLLGISWKQFLINISIFVLTVFDPSIEDSEEYKKVHQEYKATVSIYKNCET